MLWTGRPDVLAITIGGKPIAKLSDRQTVMKDVSLAPASLLARTNRAPAAPPAAPASQKPRAVSAQGPSAAPSPTASAPAASTPSAVPAASPTA
jgi:hypothetical protein